MQEEHSTIKLTKNETIEMIMALDKIVVSLDKIKAHFIYTDTSSENHDRALSNYIIDENVNHTLSQIRGILSAKFDLTVGDDDMDELERACENNNYWKLKK